VQLVRQDINFVLQLLLNFRGKISHGRAPGNSNKANSIRRKRNYPKIIEDLRAEGQTTCGGEAARSSRAAGAARSDHPAGIDTRIRRLPLWSTL
jgi:hypothetical protein